MIPKIGSIGKGLATLGRRKSWKAFEPCESSLSSSVDAKTGFSDARSDDAHIVTYSELLADGAPAWSLGGASHRSHSDTDFSSEESILSDALFDQDKVKELAHRLQRFNGKKLDHLSYADPQFSEPSSAIVPAPQRHYSENADAVLLSISKAKSRSFHDLRSPRREEAVKRSTSFHSRNSRGDRDDKKTMTSTFHSRARSHSTNRSLWAEKKDPSPESPKSTLTLEHLRESDNMLNLTTSPRPPPPPPKPSVISRENPPPPPPRNRRSPQRYPPPPPPPPPAAHFTGPRNRRSSTGEQTHHRPKALTRSLTEFSHSGPPSPRANTQEPSSHRPRQLSLSCSDTKLSRPRSNTWVGTDEPPNHRPRQLSSSCSEATFSKPKSMRISIVEEPPNHRPRHVNVSSKEESMSATRNRRVNAGEPHKNESRYLSLSCADESFSVPKRKESTGESLSSSMPNVLSDYPPHPKITRFRDDIDIATFSPFARPSVDSKRSQMKLAPEAQKQVEPEAKVSDIQTDGSGANKEKNTEDKSILDKIPFIQKVRLPQRDVRTESADHCTSPTSKKRNTARPKYDKNGRCLRHPSVIVAKKKPFAKGWDIIRSCPRCSMESSDHDLNDLSSSGNQVSADYCIGVDEILAPSNKKYDWQASSSFTSSTSFESNEVKRIEGVDDFLAAAKALASASSLSEAASRAISRSGVVDRPSMRRSNVSKSRHSFHGDEKPRNVRPSIVSKMPYKTPWGESGWYTGEVNDVGVPNGHGRMRFKSGYQHDGQWANGYSEQYLENSSRMKRGFAENRSPWKEDNGMTLAVPDRSEQSYHENLSRSVYA